MQYIHQTSAWIEAKCDTLCTRVSILVPETIQKVAGIAKTRCYNTAKLDPEPLFLELCRQKKIEEDKQQVEATKSQKQKEKFFFPTVFVLFEL